MDFRSLAVPLKSTEVFMGKTGFQVKQVDWASASDKCQFVREQVFVYEQRVDPMLEIDGLDPRAFHVLVQSPKGKPIGTGRLLPNGHIGRIAVMMSWRGKGVGSAILNELINIAEQKNLMEVHLNSQTHAIPFYERHLFEPYGPVFMEAGIPHQAMRRFL